MNIVAEYWGRFQSTLFPRLETVLEEPLTENLKQFVRILDIIRIEQFIASPHFQWMGRKASDRPVRAPLSPKPFMTFPLPNCSSKLYIFKLPYVDCVVLKTETVFRALPLSQERLPNSLRPILETRFTKLLSRHMSETKWSCM